MFKRLGVVGVVVGVSALAVGSTAPATSAGSGDDDDRTTIRVLSTVTEDTFLDVGDPDFSLGDSFIFSSELTRNGDKVGHSGVVCTVTSAVMGEFQCLGTAQFRHGSITVQGLVGTQGDPSRLAITGGTGAFEGAEGTLLVRPISDTQDRLVFSVSD